MAISFPSGGNIKRAAAIANTWTRVDLPAFARYFTVNNEDASNAAIFAYSTANGDGGGISPLDEYVTVPAGASRRVSLGQGSTSRASVPTEVYVGDNGGNTPQLALEVERAK